MCSVHQLPDTSLTSLHTLVCTERVYSTPLQPVWSSLSPPPPKKMVTFKLLTPQSGQLSNSNLLERVREAKIPGHPYLCSHSFKLHNWEAEIGFPNLSLLIHSGQFQLCGAGYCPLSPHLNETDGNLLICPSRVKASSGMLSVS